MTPRQNIVESYLAGDFEIPEDDHDFIGIKAVIEAWMGSSPAYPDTETEDPND